MRTCQICKRGFQSKVRFATEDISICLRCVNSLNENPAPAVGAEQELADMLLRGILRRASADLESPEARTRDKAQRILENPQPEVARALPAWINRLLADDENSTRPFKIMRAHRRGLVRERPGDPYDYPFDWKDKARRIRDRDHDTCADCRKVGKGFDVHHIVYLSNLGTNRQENLVTLCRPCHEKVHDREFDLPESKDPEQARPMQPKSVITNAEEQAALPKMVANPPTPLVIHPSILPRPSTQPAPSTSMEGGRSNETIVLRAKLDCNKKIEPSEATQNKAHPIPNATQVLVRVDRMGVLAYLQSLSMRASVWIYFGIYFSSIGLAAKHPLVSALALFASAAFLHWQGREREQQPHPWIFWVAMYVPVAFFIATSYNEGVDLQGFNNYLDAHQCVYVREDVLRVWGETCESKTGGCVDSAEATESVYLCSQGNEITFRNFIKRK